MGDHEGPDFDTRASYRICIRGFLEKRWSDRLGGMKIEISDPSDEPPFTTLTGQLADQSALMGVLNTLYELRYPLISVEFIWNE